MILKLDDLKTLLWEAWDPIGLRRVDEDRPRDDEYDGYAFQIWMRLKRDTPVDEIERYVLWAETERMGLKPSGKARQIAEKAIAIMAA